MLEFLTLLPQECEDAVAAAQVRRHAAQQAGAPQPALVPATPCGRRAATMPRPRCLRWCATRCPCPIPALLQSASAELAWGLKTRAHEWSPAVAAWLHAVHTAGSSGAAAGSSSRDAPPSPSQLTAAAALAGGHEDWQRLTLAVLRCFTAWVKWGCLQYVDHAHATYLTSLAGELLFAPDPARGLPFHFACLPVAVDAATEVVEHATEALQPLLLQLAVALPARAAQLQVAGSEEQAAELCHVFALFCSTHCTLCAAEGPQGQALRQVREAWEHEAGALAVLPPQCSQLPPASCPPCRRACCSCWRCRQSQAATAVALRCLPWGLSATCWSICWLAAAASGVWRRSQSSAAACPAGVRWVNRAGTAGWPVGILDASATRAALLSPPTALLQAHGVRRAPHIC